MIDYPNEVSPHPKGTIAMKTKKGMGFKAAQKNIASKEGLPMKNAGAILAKASRGASKGAKKANPNLKKIKGK